MCTIRRNQDTHTQESGYMRGTVVLKTAFRIQTGIPKGSLKPPFGTEQHVHCRFRSGCALGTSSTGLPVFASWYSIRLEVPFALPLITSLDGR
jgi:hypothetical protein